MPEAGTLAAAPKSPRLVFWLGLATLIVLADQVSKFAISGSLHYLEVRKITDFFNLVLVYNTGAAFSMLADAPGWQREFFIGIGVIASVAMIVMLRRNLAERKFCLALSLILGGALGNVWDRVALGHVVDFVQLHAGGYYWPAFNVADSAISCGAALLIWDGVFGGRSNKT